MKTGYPSIDKTHMKNEKIFYRHPFIPNMSVSNALDFMSIAYRKEVAIDCLGLNATYDEMLNSSLIMARAFMELGLKKGDIVAISMPNIYQAVISYLALNKIGVTTTFLNLFSSKEEVIHYLNEFESPIFLNYDKDYNVKVTNSVKMSNIKNISESYITLGKVYNNKKGVILSMPMLKDNNYGTQILYMKDDKLKKVFKDDKIIMNSYYVPAIDVNNDGILEIPELNNSMIENFNPNSKSSSLVSWRKWNNKVGDEANTIFISQVYYNYKSNFKFLVPNNLANKLYIKRSVLGDSNYYIFYYYDKEHSKQIELFQIGYSPKNLVEDAKASPKIESILYENNNYYYQLIVKDKEAFEKYNLTLDNMKEYFSIIYK